MAEWGVLLQDSSFWSKERGSGTKIDFMVSLFFQKKSRILFFAQLTPQNKNSYLNFNHNTNNGNNDNGNPQSLIKIKDHQPKKKISTFESSTFFRWFVWIVIDIITFCVILTIFFFEQKGQKYNFYGIKLCFFFLHLTIEKT